MLFSLIEFDFISINQILRLQKKLQEKKEMQLIIYDHIIQLSFENLLPCMCDVN